MPAQLSVERPLTTTTESLFNNEDNATFQLPSSTRDSLAAILIVHPIAAFFTLVMTILSAAAHFHKPSHSPRYLLAIFILSILTLVLALLSFLVDVLLFVPHMAWGSYIVLAATILIAASGIISCAMRRTLVSRKARKRRIEENAEMNGENFYNRQATTAPPITTNNALNGGANVDKLPAFATFEMPKKEPERTSEERVPLTTGSSNDPTLNNSTPGMAVSGYGQGQSPPRDQYGNLMQRPPPGSAYSGRSRDPSVEPALGRQYSDNSMNSRGRGMPPGGFRGRGGYPPNGRGGYGPPRGGNFGPPRGNFNGPYRGGMEMGAMAGGPPMRGGRGGPQGGYGRGPPPQGYGQRPPNQDDNYGQNYGGNNYGAAPAGGYAAYNGQPDDRSSLARAESPPPLGGVDSGPVGQAIEMDATTGNASPNGGSPRGFGQFGNLRESDGDVAGMVGLQQQKLDRQTVMTEDTVSRYSTDEYVLPRGQSARSRLTNDRYVPPRQAWGEQGRSSPLNPAVQPSELPGQGGAGGRVRRGSDHYYEDVDPRFAESAPRAPQGLVAPSYNNNQPQGGNTHLQPMDGQRSYEDLQSGSRSPAESERSTFTSVSQRGVNPRWQGPPQQGYGQQPMPRRPVNQPQQQRDMLLNTNPDFQLPGGGRGRGGARGGRGGGGMIPNSAYPGGAM